MRQIWIPKIGPPEVLQLKTAPDPTPGPDQVRISVRASGVNFADIMARLGLYPDAPRLPAVVGYEVSGIVDAVGSACNDLQVGDRVLALTNFQGYSDVVVVPASQTFQIPESISFEQAAALPVNYLTAWIMLFHFGNLQSKDLVLVHGAGGGVGLAALQICRLQGAAVIATANPDKHARLKKFGVLHCIDSQNKRFHHEVMQITQGTGVDLALDPKGGITNALSYKCLKPLGKLVLFGVSNLAPGKTRNIPAVLWNLLRMPAFRPIGLMNQNRSVCGVNLGRLWSQTEKLADMLKQILQKTSTGRLQPVVDQTFPLEHASRAHHYIQDRKNFGKVLLIP